MGETYYVCHEEQGDINISEEVITSLVKNAITEIEGVAGFSNIAGEVAELIGIKTVTKGIELNIQKDKVTVDVIINVNYGTVIVDVAKKVQAAVVDAVRNAAGIDNVTANVHVSGISLVK